MSVTAFSILTLTVGLSLSRPRIGSFRIDHASAAIIGASLTLVSGLVPPQQVMRTLAVLTVPVVTIVSLMVTTLIAERVGLFELLACRIAEASGGDGRRLFTLLFVTGTLVGTVFTNDAAVLIFTPLVVKLVRRVRDDSWTQASEVPYYFAVLYVGNLVGALTISNPINIVISSLFEIRFLEYAVWMALPAATSAAVSYVGLRIVFGRFIPRSFSKAGAFHPPDRRGLQVCTSILGVTLLGFFSEQWTGIPTWVVALVGAVTLLAWTSRGRASVVRDVLSGVGWDVIVFVLGIFVVALGMRSAGLTHQIGSLLQWLIQGHERLLPLATSLVAGVTSSVMNNHPTANVMTWVIQDFERPFDETRLLVLSALIGGDLGPKMLPIGSLAALMWFRLLRERDVHIRYRDYVKIGLPVTIAAIVLSILVLQLEFLIVRLI